MSMYFFFVLWKNMDMILHRGADVAFAPLLKTNECHACQSTLALFLPAVSNDERLHPRPWLSHRSCSAPPPLSICLPITHLSLLLSVLARAWAHGQDLLKPSSAHPIPPSSWLLHYFKLIYHLALRQSVPRIHFCPTRPSGLHVFSERSLFRVFTCICPASPLVSMPTFQITFVLNYFCAPPQPTAL